MRLPTLALLLSVVASAVGAEPAPRNISTPATEVHLGAATYSVAENDPAGAVTIILVANGNSGTVKLSTSEGTARGGPHGLPGGGTTADYESYDQSITLFSTTTPVTISLNDESLGEDSETFTVTLSLDTGPNAVPTIGSPSTATVTITDNDAPNISLSSSTGRHAETSVVVYLGFSELVDGFTAGDLQVGNATVSNLVASDAYNYQITLTGMTDGTTVSVALPLGAVTDHDPTPHSNGLASYSFIVDRSAPTCTVSTGPGPFTTSPITFNLSFSEELNGLPNNMPMSFADLTTDNGTVQTGTFTPIGSTPSVSVTVTPAHSGTVTLTVPAGWAQDVAGNLVAATSGSVTYTDVTPPTITAVTSSARDGTYGHGSIIPIRLTFSEPVTLVGSMTLHFNNNETVAFTAFSGTSVDGVYTVGPATTIPAAPLDSLTLTLDSGATLRDASNNDATLSVADAGNKLSATRNLVIVDQTPATYSIISSTTPGTYGPADGLPPIALTLVFSKQVHLVGQGIDLQLNSRASTIPGLVNPTPATPSAPDTSWPVSYTIAIGDHAAALALTSLVAQPMSALIDSDGLTLTPGAPTSNLSEVNAIIIDGVGPTVTTLAASGSTTTSPVTLTVTLSEPSSDFTVTDITVGGVGGTISDFAGSGASYTAKVAPTAAGVVTLQIGAGAFHDAVSNPNAAKSVDLTYSPDGGTGGGGAVATSSSGKCGMGSGIGALALFALMGLALLLRRRD